MEEADVPYLVIQFISTLLPSFPRKYKLTMHFSLVFLSFAATVTLATAATAAPVPACASSPMGLSFVNWDGAKSCEPSTFNAPASTEEVQEFLQRTAGAQAESNKVQCVGGGLSFSGIQLADDAHMLTLHRMNKLLRIEKLADGSGDAEVTVQAGTRIRDLVLELDHHGLAMVNLGATANQTIAGACATGTHGTGTALGALAASIRGLQIVSASGRMERLRSDSTSENERTLFAAAATGLGRMGVVTEVTVHVVPQWKMKMEQTPYALESLLADLPRLLQEHPRLQWSWEPYTLNATLVVRSDVSWDTPIAPAGPDGGCWSNTQKRNPCTDLSYKTLTDSAQHFSQRSLYTEMEMMIPAEHADAAVRAYIAWMDTVRDQHDESVQMSVMLRYVAADKLLVSPFSGRDTAVMSFIVVGDAVSAGNQAEFELYSRGLQEVCETQFSGRPHWGKVNWVGEETPEYMHSVYPELQAFKELAKKRDPEGRFLNEYLAARIGQ